jgi:hypothetical protein
MNLLRWKLILLGAFIFSSIAQAQDIDLIGNASWTKRGSRIRIHADEIHNNLETRTGFLRLQIWATAEPYDGVSDITGYVIGTYNLGTLGPGASFIDRTRTVRYRKPPPGLYYTTITLEENTTEGYVIVDSENFAGLVNLGGFGEGFAHFETTNGDVSFLGEVSWVAGNGRALITAERIVNERLSRTGSLRIRLWATDEPYLGGDVLEGFPMATTGVGRILPMSERTFQRRTSFRVPLLPGEYSVTMTLEEYFRGWNIVDYVTFQGTSLF